MGQQLGFVEGVRPRSLDEEASHVSRSLRASYFPTDTLGVSMSVVFSETLELKLIYDRDCALPVSSTS